MNDRREMIFGFLSALLSIFIVGGSFAISYAEVKPKLAQIRAETPGLTSTQTPTKIILTPRPGEATLTPSPTLPEATPTVISPTPACQFPADWIAITINAGDTLESLAKTYHTTPDALIEGNCLLINTLKVGSQLYVPQLYVSLTPTRTRTPRPIATYCAGPPSGWVIYIVQSGDTLYSLSQIYDLTVAELKAANCLSSDLIKTGSILWVPFIPTKTPLPSPSYITVIKQVINDNGGSALPNDFLLTLNGGSVTSGVKVPVDPGTYTAAETQLPGYTFEGFSGDCDSNGNVTVALGENKTCTLTNNDLQAYITVIKQVINDNGGSALPNDFLLTLNGSSVTSGVQVPVNPGTYTAAETQLPGYTFEGFSGDCDSNGNVTVAPGESKTCTLTNNDRQAYITVIKQVIKDNGGSALPDDFLLTLNGSSVTSGVQVPVNPGTYTAAETQLPGYTFEGFSGDCGSNGNVTVAPGESKTCTLTNNDQPANSTVVINDNGGSALPDAFFLLTLIGSSVTSGVQVPVDPGTYTNWHRYCNFHTNGHPNTLT